MVGPAGIPDRPLEGGTKRARLFEPVLRHHATRFRIPFTTPIEVLPRERKVEAVRNRFQHANAFGDNFTANAVSLDHRYFVGFQVSSPLSRCTPILFAAESCQSAHVRNAF